MDEVKIMKALKKPDEPYTCPVCGEESNYPKYSVGKISFLQRHYYDHKLHSLAELKAPTLPENGANR